MSYGTKIHPLISKSRIIMHGSNQSGQSVFARDLKNAYLTRGDFNVIVVDWSNFIVPYYQFARYKVGKLGIAVAKFITFLNPNYSTLHIVGYDLGMIHSFNVIEVDNTKSIKIKKKKRPLKRK